MKTPLGTEVDIGAGHIVLDGLPALRERGTTPPSFRPMYVYCGHGRPSQLLLSSCSCLITLCKFLLLRIFRLLNIFSEFLSYVNLSASLLPCKLSYVDMSLLHGPNAIGAHSSGRLQA